VFAAFRLNLFHQVDEKLSQEMMRRCDRDGAGLCRTHADIGRKDARLKLPRVGNCELTQLLPNLCVPFGCDDKEVFCEALQHSGV
jgi:hypothetical protein